MYEQWIKISSICCYNMLVFLNKYMQGSLKLKTPQQL